MSAGNELSERDRTHDCPEMIPRRHVLLPIVALAAVPLSAVARGAKIPEVLPDHYDEPLGIGLEGWPYPAPVHFYTYVIDGQSARMAYMDIPPTSGAHNLAVVLLHGKNFDSSYWEGPIKDLAGAGYRVIVPDQIGFNKSSKPSVAYSFDILAEATINLLGSLQIREAIFIGHSTGGMLAVRIATAYPGSVAKLVLEDPIGLVDYRRFIPPQQPPAPPQPQCSEPALPAIARQCTRCSRDSGTGLPVVWTLQQPENTPRD